jgi:hypothetical protein
MRRLCCSLLLTASSFVHANPVLGRALARAARHRRPTVLARFCSHVETCGTFGGQNGTIAGFL